MTDNSSIPWLCKNGHLLGRVVRNASHEQVLEVFWCSQPHRNAEREAAVNVWVTGSADVTCTLCGEVRHWEIGQATLDRLVERALENRRKIGVRRT